MHRSCRPSYRLVAKQTAMSDGVECDCDRTLSADVRKNAHYINCSTRLEERAGAVKKIVGYRNKDGTIVLPNRHLGSLSSDVLYHLALSTSTHNLEEMFGDVKFVCMGGTAERMESFARHIAVVLGHNIPLGEELQNITKASHRYAMYKIGPVLSVNHGIGIPTMTVLLQELMKLLQYAKAKDPIVIRLGTSGGLGVEPGTVVVSSFGLNGLVEKSYDLPVLGEVLKRPALFDERLAEEISSVVTESDGFKTIVGGTMAADDFYCGQGRTDGPFCHYEESDKFEFLTRLKEVGVRNIEMEATALSALTYEAGIRSADVCVTLVNRMKGDQVTTPKETLVEWQKDQW